LSLLDLAPSGGCLAADVTTRAGGLLHHHFTLAAHTEYGLGGMFLWPDPGNYFPPDVIRRCALWSADFPRFRVTSDRDHLSDLGHSDITMKPSDGLDKNQPIV
jgi:hypothetical protein